MITFIQVYFTPHGFLSPVSTPSPHVSAEPRSEPPSAIVVPLKFGLQSWRPLRGWHKVAGILRKYATFCGLDIHLYLCI